MHKYTEKQRVIRIGQHAAVCRQSLQTEQTERNEGSFEEKRASPYKSKAVEVFLQSP